MNCPVCQRTLAPTLSMCPKCGTMMNDRVREENQPRTIIYKTGQTSRSGASTMISKEISAKQAQEITNVEVSGTTRPNTAAFGSRMTDRTLNDFQNLNAALPSWRLQLQNTVRQRSGKPETMDPAPRPVKPLIHGANALKASVSEDISTNPTLENALKRIESSRQTFLNEEQKKENISAYKEPSKDFPFKLVPGSKPNSDLRSTATEVRESARPKLISSLRIEKKAYDTNKLVPLPAEAIKASSFAGSEIEVVEPEASEPRPSLKETWSQKIDIIKNALDRSTHTTQTTEDAATEELDDLAPVSMRLNAGLFDLIIGGFISLILLSPLFIWGSVSSVITGSLFFIGVLIAVMFVYLTAAVGFLGQTFGMKLFSLDLIDAESGEIPTLHQAAVNSSVYLLSLVFFGIGFIPMAFNDEKQAAHDLASGTILVKEL